MQIKPADEHEPDLEALRALLARPDVAGQTRQRIEQEIRAIAAGAKGERDAAYEIEFFCRANRNRVTIHDLRLEIDGLVAQIDHLIINRQLEVWVCESKHFVEGVGINEHGEWVRFYNGRPHGMASPLEQNHKHIEVLRRVFENGLVELPRHLGVLIKPIYRSLVLVSDEARIARPRRRVDGLECVIKCDQLRPTVERQNKEMPALEIMTRTVRTSTLADLGRGLATLHRPLVIDWAARFGLPAEPGRSATPEPSHSTTVGATEVMSPRPRGRAQLPSRTTAATPEVGASRPSSDESSSYEGAARPRPARPDRLVTLISDLNEAQREAVTACTGPVVILAGAGTGKTRVVTRRAAYAIASGAVPLDQVLVVTFTDKAAGEMAGRLAGLGLPGVTARTFHAHALSQLRYFWPSRHEGAALPDVLESKIPIIGRLARALPGGYRFTPAKDLADEIEWAKSRRIPPHRYPKEAGDRHQPIPAELFARLYADYERAKKKAGRLDFDDMLALTVELLETDEAARTVVMARKTWFSVDEYQDTNPLQQRLLELWTGARDDVCVVGDEDQTIYSFTGATSDFLTGFVARYPAAKVVTLSQNYRSSPQILEVANRLIATSGRSKRLVATEPAGPVPTIHRFPGAAAESAAMVAGIRRLTGAGTDPGEIAVLVRTNAQLEPIEEALRRAGIGYRLRGVRFFERREVHSAIQIVRHGAIEATGPALLGALRALWAAELGYDPDEEPEGREAIERQAALDTLLQIGSDLVTAEPGTDVAAFLAELERRDEGEREGAVGGVNLLTYHRAKGLEWDAVFLPMLEEGSLPIHQALDDPSALAEERRLLYVGITRARRHLGLSWAGVRAGRGAKEGHRQESRFLRDLQPSRVPQRAVGTVLPGVPVRAPRGQGNDPLFEVLRAWRSQRARADGVPAYVVAHDTTLAEIAAAHPATLAALGRVKGLGRAKLEKYGAAILEALAAARVED